jgi:hypothetical protein
LSPRSARQLLFLGGLLMAPLPVLLLGPGRVPPLRLLELGVVSLAFMVWESARGVALAVTALLLGQAALYAALLWVAAGLVARPLGRLSPRAIALLTGTLLAAALALSAGFDVYQTPFAANTARASLLGVFR